MIRKITVLLFLLIYICSSFGVFASDSFYYDDFSGYELGKQPDGITCTVSNDSKLYVSKTEVDGKEKNVTVLEHNRAPISLVKDIDSKYITGEVRFRRVDMAQTEHPAFVLVARSNKETVFRIYAESKSNKVVINSSIGSTSLLQPANLGNIYIEDGVWYTFSIYVNTETHKAGFIFKTDTIKGKTLVDNIDVRYDTDEGIMVGTDIDIDTTIEGVDDIRIYTSGNYTGKIEIDYIDFDNKDTPFELVKDKVEPLPLPLVGRTEERLIPEKNNVVVDNKVCYYSLYPIIRKNIYYAEYSKTLESFGYSASVDGDIITAYSDNSELTLDYETGVLNIDGDTFNITPSIIEADCIMIPVSEIASKLGYNVREGNNTLYISKDELFGVELSPYTFVGKTGKDGDDNIYIFHFGRRDNKFEEVGIEINGTKYKAKYFDESTGTKFGIGIADPSNILGTKYLMKPYWTNFYKETITVNKSADEMQN